MTVMFASRNSHRNDLAEHLPDEYFIGEVEIEVEPSVYRKFKNLLKKTSGERPIQAFLEQHPKILAAIMDGHLGRWVVPQKRLGAEHVPDFLLGDNSSYGVQWWAVELESPTCRMFNKSGDPSARLTHAIRQIQDWRSWLSDNRAYAQRKTTRGGLGLFGIRATLPATIFIGRASDLGESDQNRRAQMRDELRIDIASYDRLLRHAAYISGSFDELAAPMHSGTRLRQVSPSSNIGG